MDMENKKQTVDQGNVQIAGILRHSFVNGPGVRYVVFFQGCTHNCAGCQNPETHALGGGETAGIAEIIAGIQQERHLDGLTLSGGDPFLQPKACAQIAKAAHDLGLNVWAYTGWLYEDIKNGKAGHDAQLALNEIDVLVDGPFVESLKTDKALWRGSSNQRLVDIKASIAQGETITI